MSHWSRENIVLSRCVSANYKGCPTGPIRPMKLVDTHSLGHMGHMGHTITTIGILNKKT